MGARLEIAHGVEANVQHELERRGWSVQPFGQHRFGSEITTRLVRFTDSNLRPSLVRWLPDLIAARDRPIGGTPSVVLVDVKGCSRDYANVSIEQSALEVAALFADRFYTPTVFVCVSSDDPADWGVLTPRDVQQRGWPGPDENGGSGTPYVLVPKHWRRPFDGIFGAAPIARLA